VESPEITPDTDEGPLPDQSLAVQAHALRATADLIENTGTPGLHLVINAIEAGSREISIQVPEYLGTPAERTATVARLAAAVAGTAIRNERPGRTRGWISADGKIDGHGVHIFTAVGLFASAPETAPDGEADGAAAQDPGAHTPGHPDDSP
jgi:hypothetical protein